MGTESALDASKPTSTYVIEILEEILSEKYGSRCFKNCDIVDITFACIGAVDALQNCLYKFNLRHKFRKIKKAYLFSDAFFPFVDSLSIIKKQKIKIETYAPMGSKNDPDIRRDIKKHNLNFFKLSERHFKH